MPTSNKKQAKPTPEELRRARQCVPETEKPPRPVKKRTPPTITNSSAGSATKLAALGEACAAIVANQMVTSSSSSSQFVPLTMELNLDEEIAQVEKEAKEAAMKLAAAEKKVSELQEFKRQKLQAQEVRFAADRFEATIKEMEKFTNILEPIQNQWNIAQSAQKLAWDDLKQKTNSRPCAYLKKNPAHCSPTFESNLSRAVQIPLQFSKQCASLHDSIGEKIITQALSVTTKSVAEVIAAESSNNTSAAAAYKL